MKFQKELRFRDGHSTMLQYVVSTSTNRIQRSHHVTPRLPKSLPEQTYNDAVAMAAGRESGLALRCDRLLTRS